MKDKMLRIRVDESFLEKLEYLRKINGFRTVAETVRKIVEKEFRKEEYHKMENNSVHLCDSCRNCYPECSTDGHNIDFGDGKGNDNICCCNKYEPLMEHDYDRGGYK